VFAYLVAGCTLYRYVSRGDVQSLVVPLTLGGCAMLPSALGRCDIFHVYGATPAFLVGVAGIFAMPSIRRWWLPLACIFVWLLPANLYYRIWPQLFPAWIRSVPLPAQENLSYNLPPCDQTYFSPMAVLPYDAEVHRRCVDTGYYLGVLDVLSPDSIERKVDEMRQRPSEPLLLSSEALEDQFQAGPYEVSPESLHVLEFSPFVPRQRNAALTYQPIITYIRQHYTPGPVVGQTGLRVWYPSEMKAR
jgi:hypothetical protein